jgi:hypothetical protein
MYKVLAVEHRHTRIVLKCAVYQIEIITCTADRRISMKAREYRIAESLSLKG